VAYKNGETYLNKNTTHLSGFPYRVKITHYFNKRRRNSALGNPDLEHLVREISDDVFCVSAQQTPDDAL
jgi:hypothetical protein